MRPIIEFFHQMIDNGLEKEFFRCCAKVGVNVDKERLIQALKDARAFYDEGYDEGYADGKVEAVRHATWVYDSFAMYRCSNCNSPAPQYGYKKTYVAKTNYCPNCGKPMDGGGEQ